MSLRIRKAMRADSAAIAKVHVETWRSTYAGLVPDSYLLGLSTDVQEARWQKSIAEARSGESSLVAERPGGNGHEVVGFATGGPARKRGSPARAEIYTLYVLDDHQNQGIGRALLTGLLRDLLARGYRDAFLWVVAENPARFFYQAMGGTMTSRQQEAFAGALLNEEAYVWPDLVSWLTEEASDHEGQA